MGISHANHFAYKPETKDNGLELMVLRCSQQNGHQQPLDVAIDRFTLPLGFGLFRNKQYKDFAVIRCSDRQRLGESSIEEQHTLCVT